MLTHNVAFAAIDRDLHMERIAGGNETEVYLTDDGQSVVKLKADIGGDLASALTLLVDMRTTADQFAACLGPRHAVPNEYLVVGDDNDQAHVLVLQPFVRHARPLARVDYAAMSPGERAQVASELRDIIKRSLIWYLRHGSMPDLYGRTSTSSDERRRNRSPLQIPKRLWSFLVQRSLLRAHNLLLTDGPDRQVLLVDYDTVRRSALYRATYFAVRVALFGRDLAWIWWMQRGGTVPQA